MAETFRAERRSYTRNHHFLFPTAPAMKLISFLSAAALVGLAASVLDLSFHANLGLYAATASVLFLIGVVRDYAPRRPYWQPRRAAVMHFPTTPARQMERLAA
jgi:hypothetical protein